MTSNLDIKPTIYDMQLYLFGNSWETLRPYEVSDKEDLSSYCMGAANNSFYYVPEMYDCRIYLSSYRIGQVAFNRIYPSLQKYRFIAGVIHSCSHKEWENNLIYIEHDPEELDVVKEGALINWMALITSYKVTKMTKTGSSRMLKNKSAETGLYRFMERCMFGNGRGEERAYEL